MTPEVKAKELVKKFREHSAIRPNGTHKGTRTDNAKACAIICVDEIISQYQKMRDRDSYIVFEFKPTTVIDLLSYWQSVKQSLTKTL